MGVIRRTYIYLDEQTFSLLNKALVRPHLKYAAPVWDPHYKKAKEMLERVQRRATSQVPTLRNLSYKELLRKLLLPTLWYRRLRGDMVEAYKMLKGVYDEGVCKLLELEENRRWLRRGHSLKLKKKNGATVLRQNNWSERLLCACNQ